MNLKNLLTWLSFVAKELPFSSYILKSLIPGKPTIGETIYFAPFTNLSLQLVENVI